MLPIRRKSIIITALTLVKCPLSSSSSSLKLQTHCKRYACCIWWLGACGHSRLWLFRWTSNAFIPRSNVILLGSRFSWRKLRKVYLQSCLLLVVECRSYSMLRNAKNCFKHVCRPFLQNTYLHLQRLCKASQGKLRWGVGSVTKQTNLARLGGNEHDAAHSSLLHGGYDGSCWVNAAQVVHFHQFLETKATLIHTITRVSMVHYIIVGSFSHFKTWAVQSVLIHSRP